MFQVLIGAILVVSVAVQAQSQIPYKLQNIGVDEALGQVVTESYTFRDIQTQKDVKWDHLFQDNKPVLLSFVYYSCPMLCNFIATSMVDVFNQLDKKILSRINIVSVSINPKDTLNDARLFRDKYSQNLAYSNINWTFLLDKNDSVKRLAQKVGFKYKLDKNGEYSHSAALVFLSPTQQITRYIYGIAYDPLDIKLSIIESNKSNRLSSVERVLLFCYNYDPQSRKYSMAALRVMQLGGVLTIIGIILMVVFFNKKSR